MCSRAVLVLSLATLAFTGRPAGAADRPIELRIPDCPSAPLSIDAFLSSLRAELAGRTPPCCAIAAPAVATDDAGGGMSVTLSIEPCDAGTDEVSIRVFDSSRATTGQRQIALRDIPADARPRALALAVAELVRMVSQQAPAVVAPRVAPTPPAADGVAPRRPDRRLAVSAMLELRTHPGHNMSLWGLRPGVGRVHDRWQAAIELEAVSGDPSVPLGDVSTHLVALALELGPRFRWGDRALDLGGTASLGWSWMGGHTTDSANVPGSGSAAVASAGLRLGIDLPARMHHANLRILLEAGGMLHGVDATVNGHPAASLTGAYLLIGLGLQLERPR